MQSSRISALDLIPVSVPYRHRERSSRVNRDGVSDVLIRAWTDDGVFGWGESCSGANIESIVETLRAMQPLVIGRSCWESDTIRRDLWRHGIWSFRKPTASFAYAGIDMALADMCGKLAKQPVYNLFGGRSNQRVSYFYYLAWGSRDELVEQCRDGLERGYEVFYLKVGLDFEAELEMARIIRETIGPRKKLRLDANASWTVTEALRKLRQLQDLSIDFIEQPVPPDPSSALHEVRQGSSTAICVNEGLWSAEDAYRHMKQRTGDIFCFSPYWVGSLAQFQRLAFVADYEGLQICKHTHGELGIAAAACHHILLTLPNAVDGNQQTAQIMQDDVLMDFLPIASGPDWAEPSGTGLCVEVNEAKLAQYHQLYLSKGQFLPYDPAIRTNSTGALV